MPPKPNRLALVVPAAVASAAACACVIIPPPPHPPQPPTPQYLEVRSQHITLDFQHPVVHARVKTVVYNPHSAPVEGTFVFPLPAGASVTKFQFFVNGKQVAGEILPADKARQAYLQLVRRVKDPALLEYTGMGLFKARLFPVGPHKTAKIALEYVQLLKADNNLVRFFHNVRLGRRKSPSRGELLITGRIHSAVAIKSVFSPTHDIEVVRRDDHNVKFSLELTDHPYDRDFVLYYGVADTPLGLQTLTYRRPPQDGYFLLLLAPPVPTRKRRAAKDIVFVVDTSGSMRGHKISQAREALIYALETLDPQDRFGMVAFATEFRVFADRLLPATAGNIGRAKQWVKALEAAGGTDINAALLRACELAGDGERPAYILMVTDGRPTIGVRDVGEIVANVAQAAARKGGTRCRLFILGVGYDVNTHLLDLLAERSAGATGYVRPDEDLEMAISNLVDKIGSPVLTDISLSVVGRGIADVHPTRPGDLFKGEQLTVVGRYTSPGKAKVTLRGRLWGGRPKTWRWTVTLPARQWENSFLPRLWATRHIGYLLDEIRLHGPNKELKDEIVRLALKFGIVTPYTSYLVAEERERIVAGSNVGWRTAVESRAHRAGTAAAFALPGHRRQEAAHALAGVQMGKVAVDAAQTVARMKQAGAVPPAGLPGAKGGGTAAVKYAGAKVFYLDPSTGYWIDADYREGLREEFVRYLGDLYTELVMKRPDIARWLAVGERVRVALGDVGLVVAPDVRDTLQPEAIPQLGRP